MSAIAQLRRGLVYLLLSIAAFVSIFPFYWMIVGATNRSADVVTGKASFGGELSEPRTVEVVPGEVAGADFRLGSGELPPPRPVAGIGDEADDARVLLEDRLVTSGTDVLGGRFDVVDQPGGPPLRVIAPAGLTLPLIRDDRVTLTGTLRTEDGRRVLVADAVQVVGSR